MNDTPDSGLVPVGTVTEYTIMLPDAPLYLERLRIRVVGRPGDDTPRLCIELTPETSIKDLESAWAIIQHWRGELETAFPSERLGDALRTLLLSELHERQRRGESYAALAVWLTERIESALRAYLTWRDNGDTMPGAGWLDLGHPRYGWVAAMELLRWFGPQRQRDRFATEPIDDDARAATLAAALERLRSGSPAFVDSPVQAETVKNRLRVWREQTG